MYVYSNDLGWVRCAPWRQISQLSQLGKLCFTVYQAWNTWLHFGNIHCRRTAKAPWPQIGTQPLWSGWSQKKLTRGTVWMSWHQHQLFGPETHSCQSPLPEGACCHLQVETVKLFKILQYGLHIYREAEKRRIFIQKRKYSGWYGMQCVHTQSFIKILIIFEFWLPRNIYIYM